MGVINVPDYCRGTGKCDQEVQVSTLSDDWDLQRSPPLKSLANNVWAHTHTHTHTQHTLTSTHGFNNYFTAKSRSASCLLIFRIHLFWARPSSHICLTEQQVKRGQTQNSKSHLTKLNRHLTKTDVLIQSNISMHHYGCIALYEASILEKGRFWAASLGS